MKSSSSESGSSPGTTEVLKRRGVLIGAGGVVAVGVAATVAGRALQTAPPQVVAKKRVAQPGDGYQLSEHVLRYYETIRV